MTENQFCSLDEINLLTEKIIQCAFTVSNNLGIGFLEKVYENALAIEFRNNEIPFEQQAQIKVHYRSSIMGDFTVDMLVNKCVLVELKVVKTLDENHIAQCINYLKSSGRKICLLLNFGTKCIQIKRIIL